MFGDTNKSKSPLGIAIEREGFDVIVAQVADSVIALIDTPETASQGNDASVAFVEQSGIPVEKYKGAMSNGFEAVDGAGGPQQTLLSYAMQLQDSTQLSVAFRTAVVSKVMEHYNLGKQHD